MKMRTFVLIGMVCLLALAGCGGDGDGDGGGDAAREPTPDVAYAMHWWNALSPEQMVAALFGDEATMEQETAAKKMYADLDDDTKALVNAAADEIYDPDADYASVGDWWETLDCRLMRIAAGDGITADPMSPYCAHYPGSGFPRILSDEAKMHVDAVGMALLDLDEPGLFVPYVGMGKHGIGSTFEYVRTLADGSTEMQLLEYTEYAERRGRTVIIVRDDNPFQGDNCATSHWDLETGNITACIDGDGLIHSEWIPHSDGWEFPIVAGRRTSEYLYAGPENDYDHGDWVSMEFWDVVCGIEIEVPAGTFMTCRRTAVEANWSDAPIEWIEWYDPDLHLVIKSSYEDPWTPLTYSELSDYNLSE